MASQNEYEQIMKEKIIANKNRIFSENRVVQLDITDTVSHQNIALMTKYSNATHPLAFATLLVKPDKKENLYD